MSQSLSGVYTVMITPTDSDDGVNEASLRRFVDWQIESGIHGLVALGSTGEFLSLSLDQRERVMKVVIEQAAGRVPVLIGTGAEDTRDAVAASRRAEAAGADGVMVIPPFYSTPTEDELVVHYGKIASAIGIPVMVYNNPATSNVDLTPPIVARLAQIDGCDYIKESTMDVTRIRDIIELCGDRMKVFGGIMGYESFLEGAIGWVCVASNVAPRQMAQIFELVQAGDVLGARALYFSLTGLIRAVGGHRYVAGSKALLNHMGMDVGNPLPPRLPLPQAENDAMARLVSDHGLSAAVGVGR